MNSQSSFLFSFEFMSHPFRLKWPGVLKREESWNDGDHHVSPHLKWRIFPASFLDSILPLKSSSLVYWDDQKLNQQQRIELCSTSDEWTNGLERARVGVKAGWVPRRRYFVRLKLLFPFTFLMSSYLQLGKLEFILARPFPRENKLSPQNPTLSYLPFSCVKDLQLLHIQFLPRGNDFHRRIYMYVVGSFR